MLLYMIVDLLRKCGQYFRIKIRILEAASQRNTRYYQTHPLQGNYTTPAMNYNHVRLYSVQLSDSARGSICPKEPKRNQRNEAF